MKKIALISLLSTTLSVFSQQEKLSTQYLFHKLTLNPAYAGANDYMTFTGVYRNQWINIEGQPISYFSNFSMPFKKSNSSIGLNLNLDKIGPISHFNFYGNYAYRLNINDSKFVNLGIRAGLDHGVVNNSSLSGYYKGDPSFSGASRYYNKPVLGLGVYFQSEKLAAGLSIPSLLDDNIIALEDTVVYMSEQQAYIGAEYLVDISEKFSFKPATYIRYNYNSPMVVDINSYLIYNKFLWLGAGYRSSNAFMTNIMISLNRNIINNMKNELRIGYSYDFQLNDYKTNTSGSHEIMISLNFVEWLMNTKPNVDMVNPRYF